MKPNRLRVYYGPEGELATAADQGDSSGTVKVPLAEIFPLLTEALRNNRTWLKDFADDEIAISSDLYEVLLAYQHYRPMGEVV
jgi:hypothetical protein